MGIGGVGGQLDSGAGAAAGDGLAGGAAGASGVQADLRADVNRDGTIDLSGSTDDTAEETWDATHGAVFLANIDDDPLACPKQGSDIALPKCNDAVDEVINGPDDLLDLARLMTVPWPGAPEQAQGRLELSTPGASRVRRRSW